MDTPRPQQKTVYTLVERAHETAAWVPIGTGYSDRDGSIHVRLERPPPHGAISIRDTSPGTRAR
jgi:hypothetical protein